MGLGARYISIIFVAKVGREEPGYNVPKDMDERQAITYRTFKYF